MNLAASLARDERRRARVCVVDADPLSLDVTTRLAVRGPCVEDFAGEAGPGAAALGSVHEPPLWVLPSTGAGVGVTNRGAARALPRAARRLRRRGLRSRRGPRSPARVGGGLDQLDWLLVAVTPDVEPVEVTARFLEQFDGMRDRGDDRARSVRLGVVTTGDEARPTSSPDVVAKALGRPVLGSVPQLWGRAAPNLGFGAALGIAELDDAVGALFDRLDGRAVTVATVEAAFGLGDAVSHASSPKAIAPRGHAA